MKRPGLILTIASVLLAQPSLAQTIERQQKGPATLEVRFAASLSLADTIAATLIIDAAADDEINAPRDWPAESKWLLVERSAPTRDTIEPGKIRWRQTYHCAPKEPGDLPFVFPEVKLRDGKGDEQPPIAWDPIAIKVAAPTIVPDRANVRGITGVEQSAPPPTAQAPSLWWLLIVPLPPLLALVFLLRVWLHRRRPVSPLDRALYEWRRLIALKLPAHGRGERFITLLSMLLREYLERSLDWPARRQTTAEFLQACGQAALSQDDKRFLTGFVERADAVKFAHIEISEDECVRWAEKVRQFLEARSTP